MYKLTSAQIQIIQTGLSGPDQLRYFTNYWYRKPGGSTFEFDYNFEPRYKWQYKLIFARQPLIVGLMGIGSGKTLGVGMAAFTWAMATEGFRFMNGAGWVWQSQLMHTLIMQQIMDTPAQNFVDRVVEHPYPKITLKFSLGGVHYTNTLEFMSMEKNAAKIFSWRGDWINLDEAALINDLDMALMNLSTRLTGRTPGGREYLGRMSLMSNPWDNDSADSLYYYYDLARTEPDECLSISIPTSGNKNVTERQIKNTLRFIRDRDEQDRLLGGLRPEGKGKYFPKQRVDACADHYLTEYLAQNIARKTQGFKVEQVPTIGAVEFKMPSQEPYNFLLGDPGTGAFPARNAPCCAVIDTAPLPTSPAVIKAFWWGNGNKAIQPFIDKLYELKDEYHPIFIGVDSTGPQAGMVQLLNLQPLWGKDVSEPIDRLETVITGLDFSVGRKMHMLLSLKIMIEQQMLVWPDVARGIRTQLCNYDPMLDRSGEPKIAQDIVATLAMAAFAIRAIYKFKFLQENYASSEDDSVYVGNEAPHRDYRAVDAARSYRSG